MSHSQRTSLTLQSIPSKHFRDCRQRYSMRGGRSIVNAKAAGAMERMVSSKKRVKSKSSRQPWTCGPNPRSTAMLQAPAIFRRRRLAITQRWRKTRQEDNQEWDRQRSAETKVQSKGSEEYPARLAIDPQRDETPSSVHLLYLPC